MAIKLTKNELKNQKESLKMYRRYLPTLQLKKQQLQTEIRTIEARAKEVRLHRDAPVFSGAEFERAKYDLYKTPLWVDTAAEKLQEVLSLDLEAKVLDEQVRLLNSELRTTTQRVNLFEKVKIPETRANIKKITVYLGDQQVAAVVRGKISKKNLEKVHHKDEAL